MKKQFVLILFLGFFSHLFAQTNSKISGKVTDSEGNPLIGANIYLPDIKNGAVTNNEGYFEVTNIPKGKYHLTASYIGYQTVEREVNTEDKTLVKIKLQEGFILDGLVVTAQKREQSIKEIPTALTSISGSFIARSGNTDLDQLASYIPGLEMQVQSPNNPGFVVRGITSDDGASNIEPRVSVFQDGVSISKSRGSVVEIFDMERIEVLKGPQGTLFGRGAQIGALHLIQNKPKNYVDGGFSLGFGNYKYKHIEVFGNAPIVKDKFLARISAIYKKREGFIENLSGGNLNGKDTKAVRASFKWLPTEFTHFTLIANYQKDTPPGTSFKSGTYAPVKGNTSPYTFADMERGRELGLNRKVWGLTLNGKHHFNDNLSLTSITAYREFDSDEAFDSDGTVAPVLFFHEVALGKQFSQEFRFNFKIGDKFSGFAGGNYFSESGSQYVPLETDERSFIALVSPLIAPAVNKQLAPLNQLYQGMSPGYPKIQLNPVPLVKNGIATMPKNLASLLSAPLIPLSMIPAPYQSRVAPIYGLLNMPFGTNHKEYYKNYGNNSALEFFADGTYKITEKLKLTAGIRYSMEQIESAYEAGGSSKSRLGFIRNAGTNLLFMPTQKISKSDTFHSWVGRIAVNYAIDKDWEVYGTIAKGRRPNVIQFNSTPNNDGSFTSKYYHNTLNDEIVNSYEIGLKGLTLNNSLYFDLATYYYSYTNFQSSTVDPNTLKFIYKDVGDATSYGAETSIKWQINDNLSVFGNYAYIHAEFNEKDTDGNKQEYAGNTFRLTPKHSFAIGGDINLPMGNNLALFFRPVYHYKSKIFFEEDNSATESQDAYGLLDARIGIEIPKNNVQFSFFMNNILNEKYLIDAGNTGRNFGIPTFIAGAPRMWGVQIKLNL